MKIAVGGMIASGKSTLVKRLGDALEVPVMDEFEEDDYMFKTILDWLYTGQPNAEMLLQIYFLHTHYMNQQKYGGNFIVDRDIIEHWLFAQENLKDTPDVMNMYNTLFHTYMSKLTKPDMYIILDVSLDDFVDRIKTRGRSSEVDNFDDNFEYFKSLHDNYLKKLTSQCDVYGIPYQVIDTTGKTEKQVFDEAMAIWNNDDLWRSK